MYFAYRYYLDRIKGNSTMAQFLEQKTERRVQLAKERAEYDSKHARDEQRPPSTAEYPRRDDNIPLTLVRRPNERHSRPYDNSQRGIYGSRGGFRGGRGRGRSVRFCDRRGVYVTGTVEGERGNELTFVAPTRIRPGTRFRTTAAYMAATRRRKRIFGKRLTAVTPQARELSQPTGCTNRIWE